MTQAIDMRRTEEASVTDRRAMVHNLDEGIVFVGDGGVVNVDETVGAARKEAGRYGGVKANFCNIVAVAFGVLEER